MAIEPRLLNPTKVEIAQKNEALTRIDPIRRTPINMVVTDAKFQIDAQIKWVADQAGSAPVQTAVGVDEQVTGYMVLRTKDLAALGKEIKRGDRVVKIENKTVLFFVLRVEFGSHYGGEFKLQKVYFTDRKGQDG